MFEIFVPLGIAATAICVMWVGMTAGIDGSVDGKYLHEDERSDEFYSYGPVRRWVYEFYFQRSVMIRKRARIARERERAQ